MYYPIPPFPVRDVVLVPGLLLIFLHSCEIKSGSGLGTRLPKYSDKKKKKKKAKENKKETVIKVHNTKEIIFFQ